MEDKWTQMRITKDNRQAIKMAATIEGLSMNDLLEKLINEHNKKKGN